MSASAICFLGTGRANARHVRLVRRIAPGARLAVASRDRARAEVFRQRHGLAEGFGSYAEALRSAYDIVVIGVPPRLHADLIDEGLACGKHLLIEKPVVASFAELKRLYSRMAMASQVVMVAENTHFDPFHRRIKALLAGGTLGVPILLELQRLGYNRARGWRLDPAEMPLGALHEGGVHWIRRLLDLASVFERDGCDGVATVQAFTPARPLGDTPGEDTAIVVAHHRSGLISRLFHSWGLPRRSLLLEPSRFVLSAGTVWFDGLGRFGVVRGRVRRLLWPSLYGYDGYTPMWRHFLTCVAGGRRPELDAATIFRDFAYLDAAYRSLASGHPEPPEPCNTP